MALQEIFLYCWARLLQPLVFRVKSHRGKNFTTSKRNGSIYAKTHFFEKCLKVTSLAKQCLIMTGRQLVTGEPKQKLQHKKILASMQLSQPRTAGGGGSNP